jgi:hypothetical protein
MLLSPTPEVLDQCALLLEAAEKDLACCRSEPDGKALEGKGEALQEAHQLRAAVGRASLLLEAALAFQQAWTKRLGAISGGYTASGEPVGAYRGSRLVTQG